jgi:uncharacterized protein YyaL (SSP411 family)
MSRNNLDGETSPYLLQHRENPVHWQPWGPEALARAKQENKPILLSVGYAACHWCHVMAHESFENPTIAALMNDLFINIKVDREERPDLDSIYQQALALLRQPGGWPLTMFLTPDARPFFGGTYFPPEPRYGRPGFPEVLEKISEAFHSHADAVTQNAAAIGDALAKLSQPESGAGVPLDIYQPIADRLLSNIDMENGGIGDAPKFPHVPAFELLWRAWLRSRDARFRDAVTLTLIRMCQGGIYDHLGGGFARYTVDAEWLVPHFEKMLYDNAQLLQLLTLVWQDTRDKLFSDRVHETVEWVLREMRAAPNAEGKRAFASSLDADSEHEEGKFYVWNEAEIDRLLGDDAEFFKTIYDVTAHGNWEEKNILNRTAHPNLGAPEEEQLLATCRNRLLAARASRIRPGWDDKVLADWNGLMIAAMTEAALVFDRRAWLTAAIEAFDFIVTTMSSGERLFHGWREGKARHPATVDDYAQMARAALALHEATGEQRFLNHAERWTGVLDENYWDQTQGGYYFTSRDTADVIVRTKTAGDNATPAGNGVMVGVLARLFHITGKSAYREQADRIIAAFSGELNRNFFGLCTLLNQNELLQSALQAVLVGPADATETRTLAAAVYGRSLPNRIMVNVPDGTALPPSHPAAGKGMVRGKPAMYLCRGTNCSLPMTDAAALNRALAAG